MNSRRKTGCGLVVGLMMVVTSLAPAPDDAAKMKRATLLTRRLELNKRMLAVTEQRVKAGEEGLESLCQASRRLIEVYRQGGAERPEMVMAARDHLQLMNRLEVQAKSLFKAKAVSQKQLDLIEDTVLEAEIWVIDAETK